MKSAAVIAEPITTPSSDAPVEELEAYHALVDIARRKCGAIPEALLCHHVLRVTVGADWAVQRAALEAILRRLDAAKKDALRIAARPPRGRVLGAYRTQRRRQGARPYVSTLEGLDPPAGRCSCPDFAKSSLGLCKHLLVLLQAILPKPRLVAAAARELAAASPGPRLVFDPLRPLTGPGDWLLQVRWEGPHEGPRGALAQGSLRRWFTAGNGPRRLRDTFEAAPERRLALVRDLLAAVERQRDADPALPGLLAEERDRLQRHKDDAPLRRDLQRLLGSLKCPLYPYQLEGIERFVSLGRLLLADDMGLGKTAQAIAACHVLWEGGRVRRGLLVVPASLKPQWLREWQHFTSAPVTLVDGGPEERARLYERARKAPGGKAGFLLVNYEQVLRDLPQIQALAPELVVLDEAQRIKNWATKTAASVKTLDVPYRLVLTGTPMENRLDELASIMEWVDARAIEPKWRLGPWHSYQSDGGGGGARNLDTLRQRLAGSMLRRVRKDVLRQLPPRTDTRVPVEMTGQQREAHDDLNQPIAQLIARSKRRPLTPAEHLKLMSLLTTQRIISNGLAQLRFPEVWPALREAGAKAPALREGLLSPKLEALRDLVAQLVVAQGRKVVIFSQWRRMLRLADWVLGDILGEAGVRAVFFTGAEPGPRRTQNIVDFHDDPQTRVMFLTDAGGVGLNLQRAASACINLELPWNPAVLEQRIGRIYRLGQKLPIDVYNLVTEQGIEARIAELVGNKRALFTGLFDGTSNEVRFEQAGSLLSRIEQFYPVAEAAAAAAGDDEAEGPAAVEQELDDELEMADEGADDLRLAAQAGPAGVAVTEVAVEVLEAVAATEAAAAAAPGAVAEHLAPPVDAAAAGGAGPEDGAATPARERAAAGPGWQVTPPGSLPAAEAVQRLFGELRVERTERGGLRIEASAEAAGTLAALFQGMAGLLQQAAAAP